LLQKANKKYPFVKAEIKKFWCKVRSMAIHNKKPPLSPCFLSCLSAEKPAQAMLDLGHHLFILRLNLP
jgi:hypothetical protein